MEAALKAIAEPTRRHILVLVRGGERSAGEIASHFDVTRPAVSQHLTVLKDAGLITERRDGTRRLYSANPQALGGLRAAVEAMWHEALDGMAATIDKEQQG